METLTRSEAHDLIDEAQTVGELYELAAAWDMELDEDCDGELCADVADALHDWVDQCADMLAGDDGRDRGRDDDDDTGLLRPA